MSESQKAPASPSCEQRSEAEARVKDPAKLIDDALNARVALVIAKEVMEMRPDEYIEARGRFYNARHALHELIAGLRSELQDEIEARAEAVEYANNKREECAGLRSRIAELSATAESWEATCRIVAADKDAPCGHKERFIYSPDGAGKTGVGGEGKYMTEDQKSPAVEAESQRGCNIWEHDGSRHCSTHRHTWHGPFLDDECPKAGDPPYEALAVDRLKEMAEGKPPYNFDRLEAQFILAAINRRSQQDTLTGNGGDASAGQQRSSRENSELSSATSASSVKQDAGDAVQPERVGGEAGIASEPSSDRDPAEKGRVRAPESAVQEVEGERERERIANLLTIVASHTYERMSSPSSATIRVGLQYNELRKLFTEAAALLRSGSRTDTRERERVKMLDARLETTLQTLEWYVGKFGGVSNGYCKECGGYRKYDTNSNVGPCENEECKSHVSTGLLGGCLSDRGTTE